MNPEIWMKRVFDLALLGKGNTSPNPMVGAVLVKDGEVVGEGFHRKAGAPHAEIEALSRAGDRARGATLYVNLEPCAHFGKTPPCADALIKAGVGNVVIAMLDPNPKVNGAGVALLRNAGITVDVGLLEEKAKQLNEVFVKWIRTKIPFVILKWGMTLDGKIAVSGKKSEWITSEKSRERVFQMRSEYDCVLVGVNTILTDDPLLTARIPGSKNPIRIVLDSRLRTPLDSRVLKTIPDAPTWFVSGCGNPERETWLKEAGASVFCFPGTEGKVDLAALCRYLGEREITSILVEGGARVHGAFLRADLADKFVFFIAPKLVGSLNAVGLIEGWGTLSMREALLLKRVQVSRLDDDLVVEAYVT